MDKSCTYINEYYHKNFKAGMIVRCSGELGVVVGGDNYVHVKVNGQDRCYHPNDVEVAE